MKGINFKAIAHNKFLWMERDSEDKEIKQALDSLAAKKALGLEGLPMEVYRKCWYFMREEMMNIVRGLQENA